MPASETTITSAPNATSAASPEIAIHWLAGILGAPDETDTIDRLALAGFVAIRRELKQIGRAVLLENLLSEAGGTPELATLAEQIDAVARRAETLEELIDTLINREASK